MAKLTDLVIDYEPSNGAGGVPLLTKPYVVLSGLNYDEDSLKEGIFLEGPDTDQFIGPGGAYLRFPDGISQGGLDDLLESPGYKGITAGSGLVTEVNGNTKVTFIWERPLAALTDYKLFLANVLEADGTTEIEEIVTVDFQTGTGSIQELPVDSSTSVLATTAQASRAIDAIAPLSVQTTTPTDHAIQQDIGMEEIEIQFNKSIDPSSVSSNSVKVETVPISDHPSLSTTALGELATSVEVDGNKLKIKI